MNAGALGALDQYQAAVMEVAVLEAEYYRRLLENGVPRKTAEQMVIRLHDTNMEMFRR